MKTRHNKKRNTAFVYEALIREGTSAILQDDDTRKNKVVSMIKKHFKGNSLLKKDLDCYRSLYEGQDLNFEDCSRIIKEAKLQKMLIDPTALFKKQSDFIHDVNKEFDASIFNNFVPNYKSLANIYQMFSKENSPRDAVLLEKLVLDTMGRKEEVSKLSDVDNVVINSFVRKFNTKYDDQLFEEQKNVLNLYIKSFVDNSVEFKMFLNEEIARLKNLIESAKGNKYISEDKDMIEKTNLISDKLDSLKGTEINEEILSTILKVQSLVRETVENGNNN
tara:strand:- start:32 stop:862 length:831 start_codon:yes stop_codon:yes gene_type:complete